VRPFNQPRTLGYLRRLFATLALATLLSSCASYGPYHPNTSADPTNSVRGPADGHYKLAFIEFGDQGSALDTSQRKAALEVIHDAKRPLLFVYIHGWQNDANSADVCKFEHFIDTVSRFPEITGRKLDVIGVYVAWRGLDITLPVAKFLTFWSRKSTGYTIASQNGILATVSELALAARSPDKSYHHCVLLGHSFGGLVLENTISHSILDASSSGRRNTSPWDMAVAFNAADSSIGSRQLMSELDYLYKYDPARHAYVGRSPGAESGSVVEENRPFLIILQSENDIATGEFFPAGTGLFNIVNLRAHWDRVPVPGSNGQKVSESEFYDHTPGNDKYLVNYHVVPLGEASPPLSLGATDNRAFEANIKENHPDYTFYTSTTMAMKTASAATVTIILMKSVQIQERKFGGDGNLLIPETIACLSGSSACRRR
jgi:pimeloyl-ACP methyl ester carboxylesterase